MLQVLKFYWDEKGAYWSAQEYDGRIGGGRGKKYVPANGTRSRMGKGIPPKEGWAPTSSIWVFRALQETERSYQVEPILEVSDPRNWEVGLEIDRNTGVHRPCARLRGAEWFSDQLVWEPASSANTPKPGSPEWCLQVRYYGEWAEGLTAPDEVWAAVAARPEWENAIRATEEWGLFMKQEPKGWIEKFGLPSRISIREVEFDAGDDRPGPMRFSVPYTHIRVLAAREAELGSFDVEVEATVGSKSVREWVRPSTLHIGLRPAIEEAIEPLRRRQAEAQAKAEAEAEAVRAAEAAEREAARVAWMRERDQKQAAEAAAEKAAAEAARQAKAAAGETLDVRVQTPGRRYTLRVTDTKRCRVVKAPDGCNTILVVRIDQAHPDWSFEVEFCRDDGREKSRAIVKIGEWVCSSATPADTSRRPSGW